MALPAKRPASGFIQWCREKHDKDVNQKYDTTLPYSKHLDYVIKQHNKFKTLLDLPDRNLVVMGCAGHDLIEDARVTYNDILSQLSEFCNEVDAIKVADIIYCCTEEKGKDRDGRHSEKYYKELAQNELAVFVKLCDIIANVKYGILTNSDMLKKHKAEHAKTMQYLYIQRFQSMYTYLDLLFEIAVL